MGRLPASELLQEAVQVELRRLELLEAADDYIAELAAEVGEPTADEQEQADAIARRLAARAVGR